MNKMIACLLILSLVGCGEKPTTTKDETLIMPGGGIVTIQKCHAFEAKILYGEEKAVGGRDKYVVKASRGCHNYSVDKVTE
jgi:hypothetical protein